VFSGHCQLRFARRNTLSGRRPHPGSGSTGISGPRLLKWLNSLYRPALSEGIRGRLVPPLSRQLIGASPSGKAVDFDSTMRRFESSRPSQDLANEIRHFLRAPSASGCRDDDASASRRDRIGRPLTASPGVTYVANPFDRRLSQNSDGMASAEFAPGRRAVSVCASG
jgi:hypothetical protein